jgi:uncharacterized protein YqgQ
MDLEKLVAELKEKGYETEQILAELGKLVEEGQLSAEDLRKAKQLLETQEKEQAGELFGLNLI